MHVRDFDSRTDVAAASELFGQLGYPTTAQSLRRRIDSNAGDPAVDVLVAEHLGRIVGVLVMHVIAAWHVDARWALVSALVADDAARGQGTGVTLLHEAERLARSRGCSKIELSSNEARLRAHAFYERTGFEEVRKRFVKRLAAGD